MFSSEHGAIVTHDLRLAARAQGMNLGRTGADGPEKVTEMDDERATERNDMMQVRQSHRGRVLALAMLASGMVAGVGVLPASASHQTVTAVKGSAFGYWADNISLFGGAQPDTGPIPSVTLAPDASNSPQSGTATTGRVVYGPAFIFTSGPIDVSSTGSLGDTGSVTSSTNIRTVNTSRVEIFGEDNYDCCVPNGLTGAGGLKPATVTRPLTDVASTCTASTTGTTGSTTIANGWLYLDSGWSDGDAVYPEPAELAGGLAEHDPVKVALPTSPEPGKTYVGHIDLSATSRDNYVVVFNEQVRNPDGSLTVNAVHQYFGYTLAADGSRVVDAGSTLKGDLTIGQSVCGGTLAAGSHGSNDAVADFDGDGDTDRSVFRGGAWYTDGQPTAFLGVTGDIPVPGDFDGDGNDDRAVYRGGAWYTEGQATAFLGGAGDIPVPGDYNGDGRDDRAVFRPSVGGWYIEGQPTVFHGVSGDIPVPGDYDGNGSTEVGIWRPAVGGWYIVGQTTQFIGLQGDIPVPGDYDGNGSTDRGIWRPSVGGWYIQGQATQFIGLQGDVPVPGDYDRNGTTERAVWRPEFGGWYVSGQPNVFLGAKGDTPLPLPSAIYRAFFTETGAPRP